MSDELADLQRRFDGLTAAYSELGKELDRMRARIAEYERMERTATDLAVRLATMGAVVAHDDVARILRGVLEKKQSTPS